MKTLNVIRGLSLLALVALTSFEAQAISLRFKSKIFSSGPDIYACNAGVASAFLQNSVCYFGGKPEKGFCTPTTCDSAKENCNTDCVCMDKGAAGDSWINRLHLTAAPYTGPQQADKANVSIIKIASGPKFTPVFAGLDAWNRRITNVATYFMTEAYTGSYFIDICYRGSEIPNGQGSFRILTQASAIPFLVKDASGYTSLDNNRAGQEYDNLAGQIYTEKAGLSVERFVVCGNTMASADFKINDATGVPAGPANGSIFWSTASESQLRASAQSKTHGSAHDPKFCKVRYVFRETNWKSPVPNRRNTRGEGAEVCTYTKITDPYEGDADLL